MVPDTMKVPKYAIGFLCKAGGRDHNSSQVEAAAEIFLVRKKYHVYSDLGFFFAELTP